MASLRGHKTIAGICRENDISETLLRRWREQFVAAGAQRLEVPARGVDRCQPSRGSVLVVEFETIVSRVAGTPHMSEREDRTIYDHVRRTGARNVLELVTAHGVGAAYMAAAGANVTTFDHSSAGYLPSPEEVLNHAGLSDKVTLVRRDDSSYNWWLADQVETGAEYDFVYFDGAHNFTIDGLASILSEKLLVDGGWLLLDDLNWRTEISPQAVLELSPHSLPLFLSASELSEPHVRRVFELIVAPHPNFTERIEDGNWGWARKSTQTRAERSRVVFKRSLRHRLGSLTK